MKQNKHAGQIECDFTCMSYQNGQIMETESRIELPGAGESRNRELLFNGCSFSALDDDE